jgi:hypothetical protein
MTEHTTRGPESPNGERSPGASRNIARTCTTPGQAATDAQEAPPRRTGKTPGYPGRPDLDAANARVRKALSQLARDADPEARKLGVALVAEVVNVLHATAERAEQSTTAYRRMLAREKQLGHKVTELRKRQADGAA